MFKGKALFYIFGISRSKPKKSKGVGVGGGGAGVSENDLNSPVYFFLE